jgi:hypothetical protein
MNSELETLTQTLSDGPFDSPSRERLSALLAGTDLLSWFAVVDDSPYSLSDWLRSLLVFDDWLSFRGVTLRPMGSILGYLECCALGLTNPLPLPDFPAWLLENLERYGFDAIGPDASR